jgi:hypothetical protein
VTTMNSNPLGSIRAIRWMFLGSDVRIGVMNDITGSPFVTDLSECTNGRFSARLV